MLNKIVSATIIVQHNKCTTINDATLRLLIGKHKILALQLMKYEK